MEQRPEVQALLKHPPLSAVFLDLFNRATISDLTTQRDYAQKLKKEGFDAPHRVAEMTREDIKDAAIPMGHGMDLIKAAQSMLNPTTSSSAAPVSAFPVETLGAKKPTVMISYQWDSQSLALVVRDF